MELYIHIPFCVRKCRYCSFVSFTGQDSCYEEYTELILSEAKQRLSEQCEPVKTIYIGGGTPSLLPVRAFSELLSGIRSIYAPDDVTEFTCEANPGTLTKAWLDCAAENGVNRLSIGMQAFQSDLLKVLGRIHNHRAVCDSVCMAQQAGISNINLDLIFGIPGQQRSQWIETIAEAVSLRPFHISAYGLIPEEGTPLNEDIKHGVLTLPDPETERAMYEDAITYLSQNGMKQYEISNFSIPGKECIHNIGYWSQVPYIGLGISAASMVNVAISDEGMSYDRKTNPESYSSYKKMIQEKKAAASSEKVSPSDSRFETMMLGLRMNKGVSDKMFIHLHGKSVAECYGRKLDRIMAAGLLVHENGYWRLTRRGFDIQNTILIELMDD